MNGPPAFLWLASMAVYVPVWVALIFMAGTVGTPVVLRLMDWRRQDRLKESERKQRAEVAREVKLAKEQVEHAAELLVASNEVVAAANAETHEQLRTIHTLVNSTLTAALKAELGATIRQLVSLREIVELKRAGGHEPTDDTLAEIETCQARIEELEANLEDRSRQQAIVEASQKETGKTDKDESGTGGV
jgi:enoyl-CoA hydratase/carnithine racemase